MPDLLVSYDASWPQQFADAAVRVRRFGNPAWLIEHIGSTAVPGLSAKPVIDLAVRVEDRRDFEQHRPGLETGGWRVGSGVRRHPVMLLESDGRRTHIAHFFVRADWDTANHRIFRDWLISHPDDARRYEAAKWEAARTAGGGATYNAGKTAVVQEIVDRARAQLGLALVSVSDK